ncbi:non-ribosomal peptide synthetase [Pseudanabaena sp. ABRG5-3]|uniref:non-ribosomal peptide synthetase n=1 Tax=Pseudanabaena sp. ABRG5-3 TaxID=685565 RepID=UPI000DC717F6|nr:non-ribosomal peptide synthetase [Pseudanabaena sp. ABRG5-3]BBC27208.1 amino acid adenylation domain protein [Pseudanabaena sp. ABRG5-3]
MSLIQNWINDLSDRGVKLWVQGDRLRYSGSEEVLTPQLLAELSKHKAEIIATLNQNLAISDRGKLSTIQPVSRDQNLPLSFSQQRLWFLNELEGGESATYNWPAPAIALTGKLDPQVLVKTISEIVRRHEVLRTTFTNINGDIVQKIHPSQILNIPIIDLQAEPETKQAIAVKELAAAERAKPFDLQQGAIFRCQLVRLSETSHVLVLAVHHIAADGWFMGIFLKEFASIYTAFSQGEQSPLPELPIQYADFAAWQRNWLQGEVLERHLNYWRQQLAHIPPLLELPTDRPRPPIQTFQGSKVSFQLSLSLTQQLKRLGQQNGATLFMTLCTAFALLLARYCGQTDIVIGSPIANRDRAEVENLLGFFVNNLVLRIQIQQNPSFQELLTQVKKIALDAYDHQSLPFEKLVEELQPERNLSYHPLFQVMFILQNSPTQSLQIPDLSLSGIEVESNTTQLDLTLEMLDLHEGLAGNFEYNTDLFECSTIDRMVGHFQNLLEAIAINPFLKISQIPILSASEQQQILIDWNNTAVNYPQDICFQKLIELQVQRTPNAIAVIYENQKLTYQELNQKANQLAHHLLAIGIQSEQLIGICVERSLDMLVGLLGILKAGAAYVPIDPSYPRDRIEYMLSDSQAQILITQQSLINQIPAYTGLIISLDSDQHKLSQASVDNPQVVIDTNQLAYVIYTSGSTGKPKGVQVLHKGVTNFLLSMQNIPILNPDDVLVAVTTICFDIAVLELYLPLLVGAKVAIASREVARDAMQLRQLIDSEQATCLQATPSTWRMLLEVGWQGGKHFKVLCGGENLPLPLANSLASHNGFVWNLYGPTEATVWATISQVKSGDRNVSIGRPLANTQLYVLDEQLQPVPIGVAGELHIGGVQVARGYLHRPDLTAERFIPDPFAKHPEARLYKTGDRVRYLADGAIEYLGRIDFQVKLRGFRIELGEIESLLLQHSAVTQAVVVIDRHQSGSDRLVAYVIGSSGLEVSISELRNFLKENLPEYMVPATFVILDSFPLTQNGKIDRRALPKPEQSETPQEFASTNYPQDELELRIAQIWQRLLGIKSLSTHDNFFELGGHSLLAIRLSAQLEEIVGYPVPIMSIFQSPTIANLANLLRQSWTPSWNYLVPLKPNGTNPPFFCIHEGFGEVFVYRHLAKHLAANQPFYGLQAQGLDGKEAPLNRIEIMATNYLKEIRSLQPEGPYYLGGFCAGGVVAYEIAQQLHAQGQEVALLALMDTGFETEFKDDTLHSIQEFWVMRWRNFLKVPFLEKFQRIAQKPKKYLENLDGKFKLWQCKLYLKTKRSLPPDLRKFYLYHNSMMAHLEAIEHYRPQPISYPVTLINTTVFDKTRLSDYKQLWSKLALKKIDYHIIEGVHNLVFEEPEVQQIALKLQACLDKSFSDNYKDILKNKQESK